MNTEQFAAVHPGVVLTDELHGKLADWIETNYRDEISPDDLRDPKLIDESFQAIGQLASLLKLPAETLLDQ